jgi:hypothetical protein
MLLFRNVRSTLVGVLLTASLGACALAPGMRFKPGAPVDPTKPDSAPVVRQITPDLVREQKAARDTAGEEVVPLLDRFAKQAAFLDNNSDIGIVGSSVTLIDSTSRIIGNYFYFEKDSDLRCAIHRNCGSLFAHPTVMLRADVFRLTDLRYEKFLHAEDYALWLRIAKNWGMHNLRDCLLAYRIHEKSISKSNVREQASNRTVARQDILKDDAIKLSRMDMFNFNIARLRIKCMHMSARWLR